MLQVRTSASFEGSTNELTDHHHVEKISDDSLRKEIPLIFPGSWSDVSRGALFEMDVEKGCSDARGESANFTISMHERADQYNLEIDVDVGQCNLADAVEYRSENNHQTHTEFAEGQERSRDTFRTLTQRQTSTRSIPIPNRKPHLKYSRHPPSV